MDDILEKNSRFNFPERIFSLFFLSNSLFSPIELFYRKRDHICYQEKQ